MASEDKKGRKRWLIWGIWSKKKEPPHHLVHICRAVPPLVFFQGIKDIGGPSTASWSGTEFIVHYGGKEGPINVK